jgi:hypothetical protein
LESVRHNPALCTAFQKTDGSVFVNAKIVGVGYVLKENFIADAIRAFMKHVEFGDELFKKANKESEKSEAFEEYQKNGATLLLQHVYLEPSIAEGRIDFAKMATIELALSKENSSKHTWQAIQHNSNACLLFYQPPSVSFEVRGTIGIHEGDVYHKFVNLVHDLFHYSSPEKRSERRPVYVFSVDEVYDNSAVSTGFGTRIA